MGIGAYLARLGRRCIQRSDQPIILTGYAALNKLLGRTVRGGWGGAGEGVHGLWLGHTSASLCTALSQPRASCIPGH